MIRITGLSNPKNQRVESILRPPETGIIPGLSGRSNTKVLAAVTQSDGIRNLRNLRKSLRFAVRFCIFIVKVRITTITARATLTGR